MIPNVGFRRFPQVSAGFRKAIIISVCNVDTVVTVGVDDTLETVIRTCVAEEFSVENFDVSEKVSDLELTDGDTVTVNLGVPICLETSRKLIGETDINVVNRLLEDSRVDPNADDEFAIKIAAENGYLEVVKFLKMHGYQL